MALAWRPILQALLAYTTVAWACGALAQATDYQREAGIRIADNCASSQILKLSTGMYRAYCSSGGQITSARSNDGLSWTTEPGVRFFGGVNPAVFALTDGSYRMIYGVQTQNPFGETMYSAVSADGLNFTPENGVRLAPSAEENGVASVADMLRLPDGRLRMYYTSSQSIGRDATQPGIRSAWSTDQGLTWTRDDGWRLTAGQFGEAGVMDPAVVRLGDGSYKMFVTYQGMTVPPTGSNFRIFSASSPDGLNFSPDPGARVQGATNDVDANGVADPFAVALPNGSIRLYFNTTCPIGAAPNPNCTNKVVSAVSGPVVNVNAIVTGTQTSQTIAVAANPNASSNCGPNQLWIVAILPSGSWLYFTPTGWTLTAQAWGNTDAPTQVEVLHAFDVSGYPGAGLYAGYGCSAADITSNQRYALLYSVR